VQAVQTVHTKVSDKLPDAQLSVGMGSARTGVRLKSADDRQYWLEDDEQCSNASNAGNSTRHASCLMSHAAYQLLGCQHPSLAAPQLRELPKN